MFVVIETAPVVVKLLAKYGPYDAIVEHKDMEVTLAEHRKMAELPAKLQRESTNESARDDVVHNFVIQQFAQAIQRAELHPDFAALHDTIAARLREEYREAMLRTIRRVFHPAVADPEGMGVARPAEASRRKERREKGRQAQTMQTRRETATAFVTKKLREAFAVQRRNHPKLRINLLDRGRKGEHGEAGDETASGLSSPAIAGYHGVHKASNALLEVCTYVWRCRGARRGWAAERSNHR